MELAYPEKYYEKVKERFPDLTLREIDTIVKFGLRSLFINCGYGGDILLRSPYFTMYIGKFIKDKLIFYRYKLLKQSIKLRIKYKRAKTKWDGYYYFGLNDEQFQEYQSNFKNTGMGKKSRGNRKQKITFHKLKAYKLLDECLIHRQYKHIFRLKFPEDVGFTFYKEEYTTRNAQYMLMKVNNEWKQIEYFKTLRGHQRVKNIYINNPNK